MSSNPQPSLEEHFAQLLRDHGRSLWRVASSYEANRAVREELYQEICLGLWQALPRFRGECSTRTFLFRIAHNRGMSHAWRRRPAQLADAEIEVLADSRPGPEQATARKQRREKLSAAVRALPLSGRQVVTLALEGLSHREIGEVLGITENNVAVRLSRARKALQQVLGSE